MCQKPVKLPFYSARRRRSAFKIGRSVNGNTDCPVLQPQYFLPLAAKRTEFVFAQNYFLGLITQCLTLLSPCYSAGRLNRLSFCSAYFRLPVPFPEPIRVQEKISTEKCGLGIGFFADVVNNPPDIGTGKNQKGVPPLVDSQQRCRKGQCSKKPVQYPYSPKSKPNRYLRFSIRYLSGSLDQHASV